MAAGSRIQNIKIEDLCRTCLSKDVELHSIFDICAGTNTLQFIITTITGVKINKNDGLPTVVCRECMDKAVFAYDFKTKSEKADTILKGILKNEMKVYLDPQANDDQPNVKAEQNSSEDSDVDITLPLSNERDEYGQIEAIKNEHQNECLQCKRCLEVLDSSLNYQEHLTKCIKIEYEDSTFCPLCGESFNDADNLTKHMWTSHASLMGPKKRGRPKKLMTNTILNQLSARGCSIKKVPVKKFGCMLCGEQYKSKECLGIHIWEHKDTIIFTCQLCKKMYLNKINFEEHVCIEDIRKIECIENDVEDCEIKEKRLKYMTEMLLDVILNAKSNLDNMDMLQVCSVCTGLFLSKSDLINHKDTEHSLSCSRCLKVFASINSAARHRNLCQKIERKHKCNTCGLTFAYEISLNKHILKSHEGQSVSVRFIDPNSKLEERRYQCDTCNRSFYRKEQLVKHTKIHMPNEITYECDVCQKKFNRKDNLRSHKRIHDVHRNKGVTSNCLCLYCGRSFSNSSNLIVHMRRHTGEKPYKCDFCDKGFPRSSDLQCHRRSHTGEKPCICRVCGKGFSRSSRLSRHMRVHTGAKPYKCTYCDKAFSQSNDLNLHIRRHTGDKPYICEVCGDRFIQGTALHSHRRAHDHFPPSSSTTQPQVQGLAKYKVQIDISKNE